jgi:Flp pilus assembly pilin Flp
MTTLQKAEALPVVGPILNLLKMQELFLAMLALLLDYIIWQRPELEEARIPLMVVATFLIGLIMTGRLAARLDGFTSRGFWMAVFRPFRLLLQSRKFWTAVGTLLANIAVAIIPELEEVQVELMTLFTTIGIGLIGTIAWEDTSRKDVTPPAVEQPQPAAIVTGEIARLSDEEFMRVVQAVSGLIKTQIPK